MKIEIHVFGFHGILILIKGLGEVIKRVKIFDSGEYETSFLGL